MSGFRIILVKMILLIGFIGVYRNDIEEVCLQKVFLVAGALTFILAGTLWGILSIGLGEPLAV